MGTTPTMIPLLKDKVDELFLHWFSEVETQNELRKELALIRATNNTKPTPLTLSPSTQAYSTSLNSRPSSPPVPPISPTLTPRSPRRRTSSDLSRKGSRKSLRQKIHDEKTKKIYAGCAKNIKQFYFPFGEPSTVPCEEITDKDIETYFAALKDTSATLHDFKGLMKVHFFCFFV